MLRASAIIKRHISSTAFVYRSDKHPPSGYRSVGLRREGKSRWERRAALTPDAVEQLIRQTGARVFVQPSSKRIFPDDEYARAGAVLTEDLSSADIILGIKEVPEEALLSDKTYLFFSHTHKGTPKNMPMLRSILDKNIRLLDYELLTDDAGKRLVAFGKFAGNAGMVDALHGMGHRFLGMGYSTPFLHLGMTHTYRSLAGAKLAVAAMGNTIEDQGTPKHFGPLVYAFTGSGNVTQGALEIFKELPHEFVPAEDLPKLIHDKNPKLNKVYGAQLELQDYIQHKDGSPLQAFQDYIHHPDQYESNFYKTIAPYANCVVTGAYWDERYPRTLTNAQLRDIQKRQAQGSILPGKMMSLADIVCDIKGAFECLSHSTNVEDGFYYYDAIHNKEHKDAEGPGIQVMGIDILPAELPLNSSQYFSEKLFPLLKELIHPSKHSLDDLPPALANAAITDRGQLTKKHRALTKKLDQKASAAAPSTRKKSVLLLGSGMVAAPLVNHLLKRSDVHVCVASNVMQEAQALVAGRERADAVSLDISNQEQLSGLIAKSDVVVSLVPAFLHASVAQACIRERKHMVTASYVSPEMQALESHATDADVLIMNEVGLDPGIDHMSAMKIIDDAKRRNAKIQSFVSWCGGLPAPEASNMPLGYKFSWSPRGVLTASGNDAVYWTGGKKHVIAGSDLLRRHFPTVQTPFQGFAFEGLANRNSLGYAAIYGLGDLADMDTMFRGTLRYHGYSDMLHAFRKLGFLDQSAPLRQCTDWTSYFDTVLAGKSYPEKLSESSRFDAVVHKLGLARDHPMTERVWDALQWLSRMPAHAPYPTGLPNTALDTFAVVLAQQLKYLPGERDMVAMHHEFGLSHPSGKKELVTSTLVQYGNEEHTAMARTVGLPAAMTTELVLDNKIPERGILRPTLPHVYLPVLDQLESEGVKFVEKIQTLHGVHLDATGSNVWPS